jgi:hypothetical protein
LPMFFFNHKVNRASLPWLSHLSTLALFQPHQEFPVASSLATFKPIQSHIFSPPPFHLVNP